MKTEFGVQKLLSSVQNPLSSQEKKEKMIALKSIQTSFTPTKHDIFYTRRITITTKHSFVSLCKSKDSDSEDSTAEGDASKQELLARIAMLQAQKVRLTDYLDERSAYLTEFAEEASTEFDKVGEDALKELDEASARIMGNIESQMQAFEESAEMNRQEIVENDNKLAEFEGQMEEDRNEGLFFKSLKKKKPVDKAKAKEEMKKIKEVTAQNAGSKTRRNIYLALIGLLVIGIADSFINSPDWRKVAVLGAILVPLLLQFLYEQGILSETETTGNGKTDKEKK
ncbi:hypothetical protein Pint_35227 [Pistacia integerrima]|uniref:Uncharacterized protein n=1 Tax=Pistacia integerrima TaxID=434235 RepID=A0ACC0Y5Q2_9ROSI|nr:hypothetical protein Pint_35227 [Pistacia integerrima]